MITILLAENDSMTRKIIKNLLKKEGYTVKVAQNGKEALEQYDKLTEKPKLVILSSHIQKRNGLNVVQELLIKNPQCNILYMTGDPQSEKKQLLHENLRIKTKPVDTEDLLITIQKIVHA